MIALVVLELSFRVPSFVKCRLWPLWDSASSSLLFLLNLMVNFCNGFRVFVFSSFFLFLVSHFFVLCNITILAFLPCSSLAQYFHYIVILLSFLILLFN